MQKAQKAPQKAAPKVAALTYEGLPLCARDAAIVSPPKSVPKSAGKRPARALKILCATGRPMSAPEIARIEGEPYNVGYWNAALHRLSRAGRVARIEGGRRVLWTIK